MPESAHEVPFPLEPTHSSEILLGGLALSFARDEQILEATKIETKLPRAVLPHRVQRPVMVPHDAYDVDELEEPVEKLEHVEPNWGEAAMAVLVADQPPEDVSRLQGAMKLPRDMLHSLVPSNGARGNPPDARRVSAVPNIVGIRRVHEV